MEAAKDLILKRMYRILSTGEEKVAVILQRQSAMRFYMNFEIKIKCKFN